MLGLVKKDLLMVKSNLKIIAIILIVFAIMALDGEGDLSFVPAMTSVMIFLSTFSYDEYNKFDAFAITFPNGRKNIVKSKYIASLFLIFLSIVLTIIATIGIGYMKKSIDLDYILSTSIGCIFVCILIQSILFPIIFKFGIEKGRIALFVGAFGISAIIALIAKLKIFKMSISPVLLSFLESNLLLILLITSIFMLIFSYICSKRIYLRKEF